MLIGMLRRYIEHVIGKEEAEHFMGFLYLYEVVGCPYRSSVVY